MPPGHKGLHFSIRRKRRHLDLQVLVVTFCIRPTGWLQGAVLQAGGWEVWKPPMCIKGEATSSSRVITDNLPATALAYHLDCGDPVDIGAIRHSVALFIRCKIWNIYTKYAETMNNVNWTLDLLMFRCLNKATLKSGDLFIKLLLRKM